MSPKSHRNTSKKTNNNNKRSRSADGQVENARRNKRPRLESSPLSSSSSQEDTNGYDATTTSTAILPTATPKILHVTPQVFSSMSSSSLHQHHHHHHHRHHQQPSSPHSFLKSSHCHLQIKNNSMPFHLLGFHVPECMLLGTANGKGNDNSAPRNDPNISLSKAPGNKLSIQYKPQEPATYRITVSFPFKAFRNLPRLMEEYGSETGMGLRVHLGLVGSSSSGDDSSRDNNATQTPNLIHKLSLGRPFPHLIPLHRKLSSFEACVKMQLDADAYQELCREYGLGRGSSQLQEESAEGDSATNQDGDEGSSAAVTTTSTTTTTAADPQESSSTNTTTTITTFQKPLFYFTFTLGTYKRPKKKQKPSQDDLLLNMDLNAKKSTTETDPLANVSLTPLLSIQSGTFTLEEPAVQEIAVPQKNNEIKVKQLKDEINKMIAKKYPHPTMDEYKYFLNKLKEIYAYLSPAEKERAKDEARGSFLPIQTQSSVDLSRGTGSASASLAGTPTPLSATLNFDPFNSNLQQQQQQFEGDDGFEPSFDMPQ